MDRRSTLKEETGAEMELRDHIVLLGFNETALAVAEFYRHKARACRCVYMLAARVLYVMHASCRSVCVNVLDCDWMRVTGQGCADD